MIYIQTVDPMTKIRKAYASRETNVSGSDDTNVQGYTSRPEISAGTFIHFRLNQRPDVNLPQFKQEVQRLNPGSRLFRDQGG